MTMATFTCDLCGQSGLCEDDMRSHMVIAHIEQEISCPFCDLSNVTPEEMTYHVNSVHMDEQDFFRSDTTACMKNDEPRQDFVEQETELHKRKHVPDSEEASRKLIAPSNNCAAVNGKHGVSERSHEFELSSAQVSTASADETSEIPDDVLAALVAATEAECDKSIGTDFQCPLCRYVAESGAVLEVHVNTDHSDEPLEPQDISGDAFPCFVCSATFSSEGERHDHLDGHFRGKPLASSVENNQTNQYQSVLDSQAQQLRDRRMREANKLLNQAATGQSVPRTTQQGSRAQIDPKDVDNLQYCTKGVIERLRSMNGHGNTTSAIRHLCSPTDHFQSFGWDCGYRNLQTLLSCLARNPTYLQVLFGGRAVIPSVSKVQELIERAWSRGFDRVGCAQLNGKLAGTRKWIGATEIVALLSSFRVKCELHDFHRPTGPNNTHPKLFSFVSNYFKNQTSDFIPPLYFQHQGHSRTIIGVEESKDGEPTALLIFDPGNHKMSRFLSAQPRELTNAVTMLRRTMSAITARQYQIVSVVGVLDDNGCEQTKIIKSTRIP